MKREYGLKYNHDVRTIEIAVDYKIVAIKLEANEDMVIDCDGVNKLLKDGYKIWGQPYLKGEYILQAMIKKEASE